MSPSTTTFWNDVLARVRGSHGELVRAWFSELRASRLEGGVLEVLTQNDAQARYLGAECRAAFCNAAQEATGRLVSIVFKTDANAVDAVPPAAADQGRLEAEAALLNDKLTFDRFVTGPCNELAHAAAFAVAESPGDSYNPLLIYAPAGLGKTHLLQAICLAVRQHNPSLNCRYVPCELFIDRFVQAFDSGSLHGLRAAHRQLDLLVVDDVQLLAGRDRSQEEFFLLFEALHQAQRQVVLSANRSPYEIAGLDGRLASRFSSGLVVGLDPPGLETRIAILQAEAELRCVELPSDAARLIAERVSSGPRELIAAFEAVNALSGAQEAAIDWELAERALAVDTQRPVRVPAILKAVTRRLDVKKADLLGNKRSAKVKLARDAGMYLTQRLTTLSLEEIGEQLGGRGRAAVLTAIQTVRSRAEGDPQLAGLLDEMALEAKNTGY